MPPEGIVPEDLLGPWRMAASPIVMQQGMLPLILVGQAGLPGTPVAVPLPIVMQQVMRSPPPTKTVLMVLSVTT